MRTSKLLIMLILLLVVSCQPTNERTNGLLKKQLTTLACYDGQPVLSADGKFLAFSSSQLGDRHLFMLDLDDESRSALTVNEGNDEWPRFSPTDHEIVFVSTIEGKSDLWIIDKNETLLQITKTEEEQESFPVWANDGSMIYFLVSTPNGSEIKSLRRNDLSDVKVLARDSSTWGKFALDTPGNRIFVERKNRHQSDIVIAELADASVSRFLNSPFVEKDPALSPDGRWLAYCSDVSGFMEVWITGTSEITPRQVTFDSTFHANPSWSSDGRLLYFEVTTDWDIKITEVASQREETIVDHWADDENPVQSRNGEVFFVSNRGGSKGIYAMSLPSRSIRPIVVDGFDNEDIDLAPGRNELLFTSDRSGTRQLWLKSLDSSTSYMLALTGDAAPSYAARYSPGGDSVVYVSERGGSPDIWVRSLKTGKETRVTVDPRSEQHPSFSANGLVVFSSDWAGRWSIWHAPIAGGLPLPLTRDKTPYGFDDDPSVSDDESLLLFSRAWYDDRDIWLMSLTGGEKTTRTLSKDNTNQECRPRWALNGKSVVYQSGHNTDIWVVDVTPLLTK